MNARTVARFGLLSAVAMVLGYMEQFIPLAPGIPGIKLGLANTVLMYALYLMNFWSAGLLMLVKVGLTGFWNAGGIPYSLAGGLLSLILMGLMRKIKGVSTVGVSVAGAVAHNVGQLAVAAFMVNTGALMGYLPWLLVAGVGTGIMTGMIAKYVIAALGKAGNSR